MPNRNAGGILSPEDDLTKSDVTKPKFFKPCELCRYNNHLFVEFYIAKSANKMTHMTSQHTLHLGHKEFSRTC